MKKIILITILAVLNLSPGKQLSSYSESMKKIPESDKTVVTPVLESRIPSDKNLLYSCTFQLAWNDLIMDGSPAPDSVMANSLNKKLITKSILTDESYLTAVVRNKNELMELNKTLNKKFGIKSPAEINENITSQIMIYSFLVKSLQFEKDFNDITGGIYFEGGISGGKQRVKTFGINGYRKQKHAGLEKQVKICDYKNSGDFIIILNSKSLEDEIILAKVSPEGTLLDTITAIGRRLKNSKPESLKHADNLYIPEINLDVEHHYKELEGRSISKAYQWTRFSLNKKGAEVKSEARIIYKDGGRERSFIFNRPFLICLKEKGKKYPYFALWVNNTEFMTEYN